MPKKEQNNTFRLICFDALEAVCRYYNEKAVTQRNLHITISLVTFLANSALAFVVLSSDEFRKQVYIFRKGNITIFCGFIMQNPSAEQRIHGCPWCE